MNKKDTNKKAYKASRGYCGYFTSSRGDSFYLRSTKEYIVASWLSTLEGNNIRFSGEPYVNTYRPDFEVFIHNKKRFVIEVKDNVKDALDYIEKYRNEFLNHGLHYIVIYKEWHFNKLEKKANCDVNWWKQNSVYDYSGKNNPRWGVKASDKTKQLIGEKTRERRQDPEYMKKFKKSHENKMTQVVRQKLRKAQLSHQKLKRIERNRNDPFIQVSCASCGKLKAPKRKSTFIYKNYFCGGGCATRYYAENGKKWHHTDEIRLQIIRNTILNFGNKIRNCLKVDVLSENDIIEAKIKKVVNKNAQISKRSIIKYFKTFEFFNAALKEQLNGKIN
jgi:hypothetical protein